jgi:predicted nucleotidyltransferase
MVRGIFFVLRDAEVSFCVEMFLFYGYIVVKGRLKRGDTMNQYKIGTAMQDITNEAKNLFGDTLEKIVVFGSCARGDFAKDESDLDVALFLQCEPPEIVAKRNALIDATIHVDYKHNIMASYRIIPTGQLAKHKETVILYSNIINEGVSYYERA